MPPSIRISVPVTNFDSSEAKYKMAKATSFGSPIFPIGICLANFSIAFSFPYFFYKPSNNLLSINTGCIELTRISFFSRAQ